MRIHKFRNRALSGLFLLGVGVILTLSPMRTARAQQNQPASELHTMHVQGNVYMIVGAGGNVAVQTGQDGVLVVDTGLAQNADKLLAEIRKISNAPIRYVVNTHVHPDHTGGNEVIAKAGATVAGGNVTGDIQDAGSSATVVAFETVLNRMSNPGAGQTSPPQKAWPTDTFFTKDKKIFFDGEALHLIHVPAAHTDGDVIAFFRRSDVIVAGDLFVTTSYPIVDLQRGGNIQGVIGALNQLIDISIPADKQEGGTYIIPGHGRLCDQADVVEYRDMTTIIRDRVQNMIAKGMSLEQVKAARPSLDYDGVYGKRSTFWSTDNFIEAVYRSLAVKK